MKYFKIVVIFFVACVSLLPGNGYAVLDDDATESINNSNKMAFKTAFTYGLISRETYVVSSIQSIFTRNQTDSPVKSPAMVADRELTLLLKEAVQNYMFYSDKSRAVVDKFLLRPTATSENWPWDNMINFYLPATVSSFKPSISDYPNIGGKYTFWYVIHETEDSGGHTHTTTQSFVKSVADAFENVYGKVISDMGFMAPLSDQALSDNGGDGTRDVYLMDCGYYGVYGYTMPLSDNKSCPSYMVIDNDFSELAVNGVTVQEAMEVTVAHEFHHTVQFSINSYADLWIMEATSCWMESYVYPEVDDNLQYLNGDNGFFALPHIPLDDEDIQIYNSWIFLMFLSVKWDDQVIKTLWDDLASVSNGMTAVSSVLTSENSDLKTAFTEFVMKNYNQNGFYPDADVYDDVYISNGKGQTLSHRTESSHLISGIATEVNHLAAKYYKYIPGIGLAGERLLIRINGSNNSKIQVGLTIKSTNGEYTEETMPLDSNNDGYLFVEDFSASSVSSVVVQLINYSTSQDHVGMSISGGLGLEAPLAEPSSDVTHTISSDSGGGGCFVETGISAMSFVSHSSFKG